MQKNRENIPKSPRLPDAKLPPEAFNRASVEIFKQQYKEMVDLRDKVNKMGITIETLERKSRIGSRPPNRYSIDLDTIN
jgi:hypothetical protein